MTCTSCSTMIQNMVTPLAGIHSCDVNLLAEEMIIKCPPDIDHPTLVKSNHYHNNDCHY